jgi:hypothetical protein
VDLGAPRTHDAERILRDRRPAFLEPETERRLHVLQGEGGVLREAADGFQQLPGALSCGDARRQEHHVYRNCRFDGQDFFFTRNAGVAEW